VISVLYRFQGGRFHEVFRRFAQFSPIGCVTIIVRPELQVFAEAQ
jgi:hypothetical protein